MRLNEKKLLVVDDQYAIRLLLKEIFSQDGIIVLQAAGGEQAIELVAQQQPDLMLLDMKMPGMDGLEILRRVRQVIPALKVIVMTAYGELEMMEKIRSLGVVMHFPKPFDVQAVRCGVLRYLNTSPYHRPVSGTYSLL